MKVAIVRPESSINSDIEEGNDIEITKYQSAVESSAWEGGEYQPSGEGGTRSPPATLPRL